MVMDRQEEVRISKFLSYILRHGAIKENLPLRRDGYIKVSELLARPKLKGVTLEKLKYIVANNDKQRFHLQRFENIDDVANETGCNGCDTDAAITVNDNGNGSNNKNNNDENELDKWYIRANQGHSIREVDKVDLTPLTTPLDTVIHGTTYKNWQQIQQSHGISRMNRNHIHCAIGLPNDGNVVSGVRKSSEVLIYIDTEKALKDGLRFYRSANDVILTDGIDGVLSMTYFKKVVDRNGKNLL